MYKFILLVTFMALAAGSADSTKNEKESYELELSSGSGGGYLCAFGVILTPLTGAVYAVIRCLVKAGLEAFTCIAEDLVATAITTLEIGVPC